MPSLAETLAGLSQNLDDKTAALINARQNKEDALYQMKRSRELQAADPLHTFSGATQADIDESESDLAKDSNFGEAAQARQKQAEDLNLAETAYNNPGATQSRRDEFANKLALASEPAKIAAQGRVAQEEAKTRGALQEKAAQEAATQKLLETLGGGGAGKNGMTGPGSTIKPAVNANGGVSFTTNPMPALMQRSRSQLVSAREQTLQALDEAERMYPGINEAATGADQAQPGQGLMGQVGAYLGIGNSQKYGTALDQANAGGQRALYTMGVPTPFSRLAQSSSFANLEQMAGQLPGVRGLATISPLFKEHQSRWGHETPLATVQRLRHMADIMDQTVNDIDGGAGNEPQQ